jgi:hypothetical protein
MSACGTGVFVVREYFSFSASKASRVGPSLIATSTGVFFPGFKYGS